MLQVVICDKGLVYSVKARYSTCREKPQNVSKAMESNWKNMEVRGNGKQLEEDSRKKSYYKRIDDSCLKNVGVMPLQVAVVYQ